MHRVKDLVTMTIRDRLVTMLLGQPLEDLIAQRLASVSIRVDDSPGWDSLSGSGPNDRPWADKYSDLEQTLQAWQKNFFVRRLVTLTRSYAVAGGITFASDDPDVHAFLQTFWNHKQNLLHRRLGPICDEFTRSGEIFPILFTNKVDGVSYLRFVPASRIRNIETDPDDYETELRYAQLREASAEPKWWIGPGHPNAFQATGSANGGSAEAAAQLPPLMLHFAVNRPIGATRGESDLTPVLPWAKRYSEWLKDRVRLNRIRTRQCILHLKIADSALVEEKRRQLRTDNPIEKGIYVSGPDEELIAHALRIGAGDAEDDGRALRLACATAGNVGLHYLGEGETVNYATAREMGEPTTRFYAERQDDLIFAISGIIAAAYRRYCIVQGLDYPGDDQLQLTSTAMEVARQDNESLATAAKDVVQALAQMKAQGWIDDKTAATMAFKFAGEPLGSEQIEDILSRSEPAEQADDVGRESPDTGPIPDDQGA
jgi:hypothetical protein